jgi:hypothetical protein
MSSTSSAHMLVEPSSHLPKVLLEEDDIDIDLDIDPPSSPEQIKESPQIDVLSLLMGKDVDKDSLATSAAEEEMSDSDTSQSDGRNLNSSEAFESYKNYFY